MDGSRDWHQLYGPADVSGRCLGEWIGELRLRRWWGGRGGERGCHARQAALPFRATDCHGRLGWRSIVDSHRTAAHRWTLDFLCPDRGDRHRAVLLRALQVYQAPDGEHQLGGGLKGG